MNVEQLIFEYCLAYGVSSEFGERMRPLLERAKASASPKRDRLLELVERSFAEEGRRVRDAVPPSKRLTKKELALLKTVADILHGWSPPAWLAVWEQHLRPDDG